MTSGIRADQLNITKIENIIASAKNARSMLEPKWYVNYNAYENQHFMVYLPDSRQVKSVPIRGNKFFNQIPEITKQVDTRVNMLTATEVIPVVYPVNMNPVSVYWAKKIEDYLLHVYKKWLFDGVWHDAIHDATVQPVSYLMLNPPSTNDGKMDITEIDAFNVFHDPLLKDVQSEECWYFGIDSLTPIEEIYYNDNFDPKERKLVKGGDGNFSTSVYKDMLMSERFTQTGENEKKIKKAIVDQVWVKEIQKDNKPKWRILTMSEGHLLRNELTPYARHPLFSVKLHQGLLYQPSFVETKLPINRSIDLMQSRVEDMALKMVRGGLLARYGSAITRTTDENGEIMYYKLEKPDVIPVPELPPFFLNLLNMNYSLMERYGASAVTMGASPKGVKTYRTVEAIRQQDYASIKTPMDFMKITLTQLFNQVIYFASLYYLDPIGVKIHEQENFNSFEVIGAKGAKHNINRYREAGGDMTKAPAIIHQDNVVEVEFESAQSYTMEGKRQTIFEAVKGGLLSKEDAIRMLKLGNVRDILDNLLKQDQADQAKQQAQQQAQQQQPSAQGSAQGATQGTTSPSPIKPVSQNAVNPIKVGNPQSSPLRGIRVGQ